MGWCPGLYLYSATSGGAAMKIVPKMIECVKCNVDYERTVVLTAISVMQGRDLAMQVPVADASRCFLAVASWKEGTTVLPGGAGIDEYAHLVE